MEYAQQNMTTQPVIKVQNVVKRFGSLTAVDGVSLEVQAGEVFGILGPNGAGKTTLLEIIEGLQKPTSGHTWVLGFDTQTHAAAVKQRIGVQLQASSYFDQLKLTELLDLFGTFYDKRVPPRELLEQVALTDKADSLVSKLSGGQKQRFTIASALVNAPDVVFLDEPTTGLDPQARHNLWELIRKIHAQGRTIVLTTHYMEEAQQLCDRIAIMDTGKLVALDTPKALIEKLAQPYRLTIAASRPIEMDGLADAHPRIVAPNTYEFQSDDAVGVLARFQSLAAKQGIAIERLEVTPASLEDVFLSITGHALRD